MTTTIFLYVALVATAIFLIQFIISLFFGDIETDIDTNIDFDLGSLISFKGLTHFCIGMGWYMFLTGGSDATSFLIGIGVGLVFVFVLWFLYRKAYQLQKERKPEKTEALLGRECTIYMHSGTKYVVQILRDGALRELEVRSFSEKKYETGDRTVICKIEAGTVYIQ